MLIQGSVPLIPSDLLIGGHWPLCPSSSRFLSLHLLSFMCAPPSPPQPLKRSPKPSPAEDQPHSGSPDQNPDMSQPPDELPPTLSCFPSHDRSKPHLFGSIFYLLRGAQFSLPFHPTASAQCDQGLGSDGDFFSQKHVSGTRLLEAVPLAQHMGLPLPWP